MLSRAIAATLLISLALLMLVGFAESNALLSSPATVLALVITVVLPTCGAVAVLTWGRGDAKRIAARKEALRAQTRESEVLRLAAARGGRLTAIEVVTELAVTHETASALLNAMEARGVAEVGITPSGVLVYAFHDILYAGEKAEARGVLDG
ncbi:MAG TPA: hypothetical protein VE913_07765 [Longimicrobium sp.]|nr:hypothetical protein [Longimicrobium sp.]